MKVAELPKYHNHYMSRGNCLQTLSRVLHSNVKLFVKHVTHCYSFEVCLQEVGSRVNVKRCTYKLFGKTCNEQFMKEIVSSSGNRKFYPHSVYCFLNLTSSLQALVLRTGFIQQCESKREAFAAEGMSDVYDRTLWKDFLTGDGSPFLLECNNYGLLLTTI